MADKVSIESQGHRTPRDDEDANPTYYGMDVRNLEISEMARLSRYFFLPIFLIIKLFRIRLKQRFGIRYPVRLQHLDAKDLSQDLQDRFDNAQERWKALGFEHACTIRLETAGCEEILASISIHSQWPITGTTMIVSVTMETGQRIDRTSYACGSASDPGGEIATLSTRKQLKDPPGADRVYLADASPESVFERHRSRLSPSSLEAGPFTAPRVLGRIEDRYNHDLDFHIRRRAFTAIPLDKLPRDPKGTGICERCGDRNGHRRRFRGQDLCQGCIRRVAKHTFSRSMNGLGKALSILAVGLTSLYFVDRFFVPVDSSRPLIRIVLLVLAIIVVLWAIIILRTTNRKVRDEKPREGSKAE